MNSKIEKGIVKFYKDHEGYGFITVKETGEEIYFHATGVDKGSKKKIFKDDSVSFERTTYNDKIRAVNVCKIS